MATFTSWNAELYHHGILGMKWGVRRFQNKDGSLTPAGLKRKRVRDMTDDELKQRINRMELEDRYRSLNKGFIGRAADAYRSYKKDQANWREKKAKLMVAKTARNNEPLRKALQSLPAGIINSATKITTKRIEEFGDLVLGELPKAAIKKSKEVAKSRAGKSKKEKTGPTLRERMRDARNRRQYNLPKELI